MPEWISQNAPSLIILAITILVIGFLVYRVIKGHIAAASSGKPACFSCPYAKKCSGSTTPCNCNTENGVSKSNNNASS